MRDATAAGAKVPGTEPREGTPRTLCRVCLQERENVLFVAREMMYGTREEFEYFRCGECGCIQIREAPADMTPHYPEGYYSYAAKEKASSRFISLFRKARARWCILGAGVLGRAVSCAVPEPPMFDYLRRCKVDFDSAVLDVGSGAGSFLRDLERLGFRNLTGVDPYLPNEIRRGSIRVVKGMIADLAGPFDLVIMRDSLEHLPDQHAVFSRLRRIVSRDGHVLILMPLVGQAWDTYGVNWVGLDPPRHLVVHSEHSIGLLARAYGFEVQHSVHVSNEDQFIGSEQYARDIGLFAAASYYVDPQTSPFGKSAIRLFKEEAKALNRQRRGDRIAIVLAKNPGKMGGDS